MDGSALMVWKQSPLPSSYLAFALQEMTLLPSGQHVGMPDRKVGDRTTQYMLLSLVPGQQPCMGFCLLHTSTLHPASSRGSPDVQPAAGQEAGAR